MEGVDLVGVADKSEEGLDTIRRVHCSVPLFSNARDMIKANTPDLLDIATPPATHAELIRLGIALGVGHIVCQKPFSSTLEEAQVLTEEAIDADIDLIIHENFRFQPWYRKIASILFEGKLGDVQQARFALRPGDGAAADAYTDRQPYFREMPKFLMRETGIHFIDTFRFLFGEPSAVYADLRRVNPMIVGEDSGLVIFDMPAGGRCTFDGNRTLDHSAQNRRLTMGEMEIEGTRATLRLDGEGVIRLRYQGSSDWQMVPLDFHADLFGGNCVEAFQAHVFEAWKGTGSFETAAADYLRNLKIEAMVYQSAESGRKLLI